MEKVTKGIISSSDSLWDRTKLCRAIRWDEMGWDGMGLVLCRAIRWDEMGWDGMGLVLCHAIRWDEMGWD